MIACDGSVVVDLNAAAVAVISPMDIARFRELYRLCDLKLVAEVDGKVVFKKVVLPYFKIHSGKLTSYLTCRKRIEPYNFLSDGD